MRNMMLSAMTLAGAMLLASCQQAAPRGPHADLPDPAFDFTTFYVTWQGVDRPELFQYLEAARPEIAQLCFFGPMFHSYADRPESTGYPMQLPVAGQREAIAAEKEIIRRAHELGIKVVSHFQMSSVIENTRVAKGIFTQDFYPNRWPIDLVGPKPCENAMDLMERDAEGKPIITDIYANLCMSSPYARQALKQMLKLALDCGVDGIMANYNYHAPCVCPYCQASFKRYLSANYSLAQLKELFGIEDMATHTFTEIPAQIQGYPNPETATELHWAAMRWAAINFKEAYDEILVKYGRSLKPDLILATWNHMGRVMSPIEERTFLPIELWGRGENYFWYSGAYGSPDTANGKLNDAWLNCTYMRAFTEGKPFMQGRYEKVRMRNAIAEGMATGGAGMGLYMTPHQPGTIESGVAYTKFLHEYSAFYRGQESYAEVALLLPRQAVQCGITKGMDILRDLGQELGKRHVQFDIVIDQRLEIERLNRYAAVIVPLPQALPEARIRQLRAYARSGGNLIVIGQGLFDESGRKPSPESFAPSDGEPRVVVQPDTDAARSADTIVESCGDRLSRFEVPWTVRVSAFIKPGRLLLHFVNYNVNEEKAAKGQAPADEEPVAAENLAASVMLPEGARATGVLLVSPDQPAFRPEWKQVGRRLDLQIPRLIVYSVAEIKFK